MNSIAATMSLYSLAPKKKRKKKIIKHVSLHGLITRLVFFFFEVHEERSSFSDKDFCDEEKQKRC